MADGSTSESVHAAPAVASAVASAVGTRMRRLALTPVTTDTARECPWCGRWALKDEACNWVCCGLAVGNVFHPHSGCGRQWCFLCGLKLCGAPMHDPATGAATAPAVSSNHSATCCRADPDFSEAEFCPGGHNSHCPPRWAAATPSAPSESEAHHHCP